MFYSIWYSCAFKKFSADGRGRKRKKKEEEESGSGSDDGGSDDDRPKKRGRPRMTQRECIKGFTDAEVWHLQHLNFSFWTPCLKILQQDEVMDKLLYNFI